ncbi:MAG: hypothetical protein WC565_07950 [Parcubacteria group bacterium]|jgi:hypothetical protein
MKDRLRKRRQAKHPAKLQRFRLRNRTGHFSYTLMLCANTFAVALDALEAMRRAPFVDMDLDTWGAQLEQVIGKLR